MDLATLAEIKDYTKTAVNASLDPLHSLAHLQRMGKNGYWIVKNLKVWDIVDVNLLEAICYLHDIPVNLSEKTFLGALGKHFFEEILVRKYLPPVLERFELTAAEKETIFGAVFMHCFSIPYRRLRKSKDLYTQILQDADSLDYFSTEREKSLQAAKKQSLYLFSLATFSHWYFVLGRKYLKWFLNFPQLVKYAGRISQ